MRISVRMRNLRGQCWTTYLIVRALKFAFELMFLGLLILVSSSSAVLAESANSDFKRGESAEAHAEGLRYRV